MAERISKSECDRFVKAAKCCAGIAGCVESDECPMWRAGDCERNFGGMVLALDALAAELELAKQARAQAENERDELKAKVAGLESELKLNAKMLARQTDLARAAETPAAGAMPWRLQIAARVLAEMAVADNMRTIAEDCCDALRYADALLAAAQAGGAS
jgi:hypothetical protein